MNKKHCDFCDQVITDDFYRIAKHSVNEDGAHFPALNYKEMCGECWQWFKAMREAQQQGEISVSWTDKEQQRELTKLIEYGSFEGLKGKNDYEV